LQIYYPFLKEYFQNHFFEQKDFILTTFLKQEKQIQKIIQDQPTNFEENEEESPIRLNDIFQSAISFILPFFIKTYSNFNIKEKILFDQFILFLLESKLLSNSSFTKPVLNFFILTSQNNLDIKNCLMKIESNTIEHVQQVLNGKYSWKFDNSKSCVNPILINKYLTNIHTILPKSPLSHSRMKRAIPL
jgi:hypothetical protein